MPRFSNFPTGFASGVALSGFPLTDIRQGDSQVFWVDSTHSSASNGNSGDFNHPYATVAGILDSGKLAANNGDLVLVAEGHVENIAAAAGWDVDTAGITIRGMGYGRNGPTMTFITAAGADIDIDAANITFDNMIFDVTGVDAVTGAIDVNAADFTIMNCEIIGADACGQMVRCIVGATAADRMRVINNICRSTNAGAASFINLVGTADGTEIAWNHIYGDFSVAAIENAACNVLTNVKIHHNYIQNDNNGNFAVELVSATTGVIHDNYVVTDAYATAMDWGACQNFGNKYADDGDTDTKAIDIPLVSSTGSTQDLTNIIDKLDGATGVATWAAGAAAASGVSISEVLRYVQDQIINGTGTVLDTNTSLYGVLAGATGIPTFPAAALPANSVSIAEVLREAYDQEDKAVANAAATLVTGTTIFTIAGGPIEILSLVARCVTGNDATASTLQWSADPTDGAAATFSGASASLANALAGALVILLGTALTTAPTVTTTGVGLSFTGATPTNGIIVGAGIITTTIGAGSPTGTWMHHMRYRPLARGVTVT